MQRIYDFVLKEHLSSWQQMAFLVGPRQSGKTTLSKNTETFGYPVTYMNWDYEEDRLLITGSIESLLAEKGLLKASDKKQVLIFDEIHKFHHWRNYIKGIYDKYRQKMSIIVTGSSKLDAFKSVGDSLMGRYFLYHIHPFTLAELTTPNLVDLELRNPSKPENGLLETLLEFGGFPDPFINNSKRFYNKWITLRLEQLFQDDIKSLTRIHDIGNLKLMARILKNQIGQLMNYSNMASKVKVSVDTIINWIDLLCSFYYCYTIKPWSQNLPRALIKQPKIYLWDWSEVLEIGARHENFIASHLKKAIDFWTDTGLGKYDLFFIRDKEQNEVDFLVTKNGVPWFLVEVKSSGKNGISKSLYKMQEKTKAKHAFQLAFNEPFIEKNCFDYTEPVIVPVTTFLSQLI